jgi:hypothetical protein
MMGLFLWRCCGIEFLALHKLQFSVGSCGSLLYSDFELMMILSFD